MVAWARLSLPSPHRPRQGILQSDWTPVSIFITCMQTGLLLVHFKSQNLQRGATCLRWRWLHCWFNWQTAVCPPLQESVWQTRRWNTGRIPSTTRLRFYCVGLYIHRVSVSFLKAQYEAHTFNLVSEGYVLITCIMCLMIEMLMLLFGFACIVAG